MTQETKKRIHLAYGIVVSAVSILAGICLIAACCNIYYSGVASGAGQIYTQEIVAESFAKIAIPVYSCLALVIGGMILNMALPLEKAKVKPEKNLPLILQKLREKTDLASCDESLRNAITKEQKRRYYLSLTAAVFAFCFFKGFISSACSAEHWGSDSTPSMVKAALEMVFHFSLPFAFTVFATYQDRKSIEREIELMRQAAAQAPKTPETTVPKVRSNRTASIARIAILAIGAALVILGACNEGTADILTKAVNICTECVGLG